MRKDERFSNGDALHVGLRFESVVKKKSASAFVLRDNNAYVILLPLRKMARTNLFHRSSARVLSRSPSVMALERTPPHVVEEFSKPDTREKRGNERT
jgi:hypothetical protein